ncbi:hypothetical protein EMCRGX_G023933 [Ephydatia muelleri]
MQGSGDGDTDAVLAQNLFLQELASDHSPDVMETDEGHGSVGEVWPTSSPTIQRDDQCRAEQLAGMRHWLDSCRKMKMLCTMPQETGLMESLQRHTGQPHQRDQRRPHLLTDQYQFLSMGGATKRDIGPCLL